MTPEVITEFSRFVDDLVTINQSIANFSSMKGSLLNDVMILPKSRRHELLPEYDGRLHGAANLA